MTEEFEILYQLVFFSAAVALVLLERVRALQRQPVQIARRWTSNIGLFLIGSGVTAAEGAGEGTLVSAASSSFNALPLPLVSTRSFDTLDSVAMLPLSECSRSRRPRRLLPPATS